MLTDEEVLEIAEQLTWYDADVERLDPIQFARAVEAKIEAKLREQNEPAIYQWTLRRDGFVQYTHLPNNQLEFPGWEVTPLYKNPAPIPEGMVLVPVEPTQAMLIQITPASAELSEWRVNYKEMLKAVRSGE